MLSSPITDATPLREGPFHKLEDSFCHLRTHFGHNHRAPYVVGEPWPTFNSLEMKRTLKPSFMIDERRVFHYPAGRLWWNACTYRLMAEVRNANSRHQRSGQLRVL